LRDITTQKNQGNINPVVLKPVTEEIRDKKKASKSDALSITLRKREENLSCFCM